VKATLTQQQLSNDYLKALSQAKTNKEVVQLRKDSYAKNILLYMQGSLSLDQTLNSFTAMATADYNLTTSLINIQLAKAKIQINNSIN